MSFFIIILIIAIYLCFSVLLVFSKQESKLESEPLKLKREFLDEELIQASKQRIASLYNISIDKISLESDLVYDLKVSKKLFKSYPLEILVDDIYYASGGALGENLNTVKDYCDYVIYCYNKGDKRDILSSLNLINDY